MAYESNKGSGFSLNGQAQYLRNCDAYNNGASGVVSTGVTHFIAESCNFVKNTTYGLSIAVANSFGQIINCGFGTGSQANGTADTLLTGSSIEVSASVNYASGVTPWVDPANGDFRINLAAAKNAGRGTFTETATSYSGTAGYPDIGAAQHLDAGGVILNPSLEGV